METIAFANGIAQIAVIWIAFAYVRSDVLRNIIVTVAGAATLCSFVGLAWLVWGDAGMATIGAWSIYIVIGAGVIASIVIGLRSGRTRFAWPQGRYQRYRTYRRI